MSFVAINPAPLALAEAFQIVGIALGLGLLVGIQRERVDAPLAGVRTFTLITLLGALCGMLTPMFGPWVVVAGLLCLAIVIAAGNLMQREQKRPDTGITTEISILLMYSIGAYLVFGHRPLAVVLGAGVSVLLHFKPAMHGFVDRLGETDMRVMMQFVLISLVVLPVLPDRAFGPFDVLNPRDIWWMVVLVVGISLAGYVALKLYGGRAGIVLGGIIGGRISSTATTVSHARRATTTHAGIAASTLVIAIASSIAFVRVLIEVGAVAQHGWPGIAPPIVIMLLVSIALCCYVWWTHRNLKTELPEQGNPTEMKSAVMFGVLYAVVLLAVATARHYFGVRGLWIAAGISGLTDMDAITLSTSRLVADGAVATGTAWRAIVIAVIANLVFKGVMVTMLGGPVLARHVWVLFAIQIAAGLALLMLWPG